MLHAVPGPLLQLIFVPLLAFLLGRIRFFGARIPGSVLLSATVLAIAIGSLDMLPRARGAGLLISRFADDEVGARSRIFREELAAGMRSLSKLEPVRFPGAISGHRDAVKALGDSGGALIWGSTRWVSVSLHSFPRRGGLKAAAAELGGIEIADPSPLFGISHATDVGTIGFLRDLFVAVVSGRYRVPGDVRRRTLDEVMLLGAARSQARWSSVAHRALPAMVLADSYFEEAVNGAGYQPRAMRCALAMYAFGSEQLRLGDNPELRAALLNNWAAALWVQSLHESRVKGARKKARRLLKLAIKTKKEPNRYQLELRAWKVARRNLKVVKKRAIQSRSGKGKRAKRG